MDPFLLSLCILTVGIGIAALLAVLIFPWPLWLVPPALVILFALVDTLLCHIAPK